jgi:hypothetical protein
MQFHSELDVMFPVRMSSQLKQEGQDAAHALGMNFSQFIRQAIQRNITIAKEVDREISARLFNGLEGNP